MTAALAPGEVTCIDGFLTADQCAELLDDLRFAWWWLSPLIRKNPDGTLLSHTSYRRTSMTTSEEWLSEHSVRLLRQVERRLADRFGLDPAHLEMWQASRYRRGDAFDEHHDAGFFGDDPRGERTTTVLVYLEAHRDGGSTLFPRLGQRFHPAPGRLLVWANLLPDGSVDERLRHEARPARTIKTVLTTWARQRTTRNPPS
ncbi:MAG: 2OG-Fe(II) oxygenase [Actinobacteria bacterium]|nr:2OG-Fe(II) oxygenase [Actinomycetota bacterium]